MEKPDWNLVLLNVLFAAAGGLVRVLRGSGTNHSTWMEYLSGAFVGLFTGMVVYSFCKHFGLGDWGTGGLTALGGAAGLPLLDAMTGALKWRITREVGGGDVPPPERLV